MFFQREMEALAFERMSAKGHGPRLLAKFPAGRVEEFLHAEVRGGMCPGVWEWVRNAGL